MPCLELEDLKRLLKGADARKAAIIRLLAFPGIRVAELCNLNWSDLDMQTGELFVRRGKGRKDRVTVASPKTRRALFPYRSTLKAPSGPDTPMIQDRGGRRFSPCWLSHMVRKLGKRKGLDLYLTPHALRWTFALLSPRKGMDLLSLQRLMGHADLSTTSHHVQLLDEDLIAAHRRADIDSELQPKGTVAPLTSSSTRH